MIRPPAVFGLAPPQTFRGPGVNPRHLSDPVPAFHELLLVPRTSVRAL
jgi:hypothetical protein